MAKESIDVFGAMKEAGLNDNEVRVYEACLRLGKSTASRIAERSRVPRTTAYDVIHSLMEKGLVCCVKQDNVSFFEANTPEALISSLDEKRELLSSVLPEFKKIKPVASGSVAESLSGAAGIKTAMEDVLAEKKPALAFCSDRNLRNLFKIYVPQFIKKRIEAGIFIKVIAEDTSHARKALKEKDKGELRETRFIPNFDLIPCTVYIYGDNVALLNTNPDEPSAMLVRDKNIAATLKLLFELLWEKAEK